MIEEEELENIRYTSIDQIPEWPLALLAYERVFVKDMRR